MWLGLEELVVNVDSVTHHDECPDPGHCFQNSNRVQWVEETLVVHEGLLALLGKVRHTVFFKKSQEWVSNEIEAQNESHQDKWVLCVIIDDVGGYDQDSVSVGWEHISEELWRLLDDGNLSVVLGTDDLLSLLAEKGTLACFVW